MKRHRTVTAPPRLDQGALRKVVDVTLAAAVKRERLLAQITDALLAGEDVAALALMRQYCGIPTTQVMP